MFDHAIQFLNGFACILIATEDWLILMHPRMGIQPWKDWFFEYLNGVERWEHSSDKYKT